MKLTKTVLAVAIAGIAAVPMMASATTTLSGAVALQIKGSDAEGDTPNLNDEPTGAGDVKIGVDDVILNLNSSQGLNNGLTGYGNLRIDLDNFSGEEIGKADNVYVGVKGGFGDLRIGEVANPGEYGQVADIVNDMGTGINQGIGYVGSFGGATVGLSYSPVANHDLFAVGAKFAWNGLALGVGMQNQDEKTNISASVGFSYAGASISLGMNQVEDGAGTDDETAIAANVGYSIAGVSLGLTYQGEQESEDAVIRLDAGYDLGGGLGVSTRINAFSGADSLADSTNWRFQFTKSF